MQTECLPVHQAPAAIVTVMPALWEGVLWLLSILEYCVCGDHELMPSDAETQT